MTLKLTDLLKSDFKHYRFVCPRTDFKEDDCWWIEQNLGHGITAQNCIKFVYMESLQVGENYDLGYCLTYGNGCNCSANHVAVVLDKAKFLKFSYLQCDFEKETLYIHLKRKELN